MRLNRKNYVLNAEKLPNKDFRASSKKASYLFIFLYLLGALPACKTGEKAKVNKVEQPKPDDSGFLLTEMTEGQISAVSSLSALAVATTVIATKSFERPNFLRQFKSSGTSDMMRNFHKLPPEIKKQILQENIRKLKTLRAQTGSSGPIKVLVVGASGGHGHVSTYLSMSKVLLNTPGAEGLFQVKYVDPWFLPVETWNKKMAAQDGPGLKKLVNMQQYAEPIIDNPLGRWLVKKRMQAALKNPDVVVQAEHIGSRALSAITDDLGAQHRLVPTDYQIDHFVLGLKATGDSIKYRVDTPHDVEANNKVLQKQDIKGAVVSGYPVRWEMLSMSSRLQNDNPDIQKKAQADVDNIVKNLGNKSFDKARGDKSILVMMGGAATNKDSMQDYIRGVFDSSGKIVPNGDGRIHLYMAQTSEFGNSLQDYLKSLEAKNKALAGKIEIHPLKYLNGAEISALMHNGITLAKSGGGTIAELATMRGTAVFDVTLSKHIEWEKFSYELFEKNQWGFPMNNKGTDVGDKIVSAFESKTKMLTDPDFIKPGKNEFQLDWPQKVLADQITIEQKKLLNQSGIEDLDGPRWTPDDLNKGDLTDFKPSTKRVNTDISTLRKGVGAAAAITAVTSAILAAWIASPEKVKNNVKDRFDLAGSSNYGSCLIKKLLDSPVCISYKHQLAEKNLQSACEEISGSSWHANQTCNQSTFKKKCSLANGGIQVLSNSSDFSCIEVEAQLAFATLSEN